MPQSAGSIGRHPFQKDLWRRRIPNVKIQMTNVEYDPVKKRLADLIRGHALLRRWFFAGLGVVFLREWYVKRAIRKLPLSRKDALAILDAGAGFGQYSYYCAKRFPRAEILALDIEDPR